jgi:hypothetical protein
MFLNIMLCQNSKKSYAKEITLLMLVHVFVPKKCTSQWTKKFEYIEKYMKKYMNHVHI